MRSVQFTKFRDMPIYEPKKGKKPSKVVLVAPHENEHGPVLPFQTALAKKLMSEGIVTEEKIVSGMMERGWEIRRKAHEFELEKTDPQKFRSIITAVLGLEDNVIRMRIISEAIKTGDNDIVILEMHAQTAGYSEDDIFVHDGGFRRLKGTKSLVRIEESGALGFLDIMEDIWYGKEISENFSIASIIAKLRGWDIEELLKESETKVIELAPYRKRLILVELSPILVDLPLDHPMYSYYYTKEGYVTGLVSGFEECYCRDIRESPGFSEQDLEKVASILVI